MLKIDEKTEVLLGILAKLDGRTKKAELHQILDKMVLTDERLFNAIRVRVMFGHGLAKLQESELSKYKFNKAELQCIIDMFGPMFLKYSDALLKLGDMMASINEPDK